MLACLLVFGTGPALGRASPVVALCIEQDQQLNMHALQVIPISHREHGLVIAAGICICVGPVLLTLLMLWEFKFAPKKHL